MTLQELVEPLFLYLCRLNRSARAGGPAPAPREARDGLIALLSQMRATAAATPHLALQMRELEPALLLFIDEMHERRDGPLARGLRPIQQRVKRAPEAGRLLAIVDETLEDPSSAGAERLGILQTCLALAFAGRPESAGARERAALIALRLGASEPEPAKPLTGDLTRRTRRALISLAFALVGASTAVVAAQLRAYDHDARQLRSTLQTIVAATQPTQPEPRR